MLFRSIVLDIYGRDGEISADPDSLDLPFFHPFIDGDAADAEQLGQLRDGDIFVLV